MELEEEVMQITIKNEIPNTMFDLLLRLNLREKKYY